MHPQASCPQRYKERLRCVPPNLGSAFSSVSNERTVTSTLVTATSGHWIGKFILRAFLVAFLILLSSCFQSMEVACENNGRNSYQAYNLLEMDFPSKKKFLAFNSQWDIFFPGHGPVSKDSSTIWLSSLCLHQPWSSPVDVAWPKTSPL